MPEKYDREKIEELWQRIITATQGFDKAQSLDDLIELRIVVEQYLSAFEQTFRNRFVNNVELAKVQMPVKDGFVDYESYCISRCWKVVEWLMQLQEIIDTQRNEKDCSHQHLFERSATVAA